MQRSTFNLRRTPLALPALCTGIGVCLGEVLPGAFALYVILGLAACVAAVFRLSPRTGCLALAAAATLAGASRHSLNGVAWSPFDLRRQAADAGILCTLRGRVVETPFERVQEIRGRSVTRTTAKLDVEWIRTGQGDWSPARGRIWASASGSVSNRAWRGALVEVQGVLQRPESSTIPGSFDWATYLRRQGIHHELKTSGPGDWASLDPLPAPPLPLMERMQLWGKEALARGLPVEDTALQLIWAMTLGWKTTFDPEVQNPFMQSGTLHVFAISGLHIALIATLLVSALQILGLPRHLSGGLALPTLWAYTAMTGWQASAVRSAVMMSVVVLTWILHRPGNLINSLCGAGLALLLWDPDQLFQPGFQLSFGVVLSLATFGDSLKSWLLDRVESPSLLPEDLQSRPGKMLRKGTRALALNLSVSTAAWLGSLPLVAWYFHVLNPVSLIANLIVVPLSSACLASSLAALACAPFWNWATECLNHGSWFWMRLMMESSRIASLVPGGWTHVPQPGGLLVVAYYLALILVWKKSVIPRHWRNILVGILISLLAATALQILETRRDTRFALIPRRGGAAALVSPAAWEDRWLLDPGDAGSAERVVAPYLHANGMDRLDHLAVTHGSSTSGGGALWMTQQFPTKRMHAPSARLRSPALRRWMEEAAGTGTKAVSLHARGDQVGPWTVLHPPRSPRAQVADEAPLVLKGVFDGVRVLWIPPLNVRGQNQLLESGADLRSEVVIAGIPAQGGALRDELIQRIRPGMVVVTESSGLARRRSLETLRNRLAAQVKEVWILAESGYMEIRIRDGTWKVIGGKRGLVPDFEMRMTPDPDPTEAGVDSGLREVPTPDGQEPILGPGR